MTLDLKNVASVWLASIDELSGRVFQKASHGEETSVHGQVIIQRLSGSMVVQGRAESCGAQFDLETTSIEAPYSSEQMTDRCLDQ